VKESRADDGVVECYTCGKIMRLGTRDCQAGHYLAKSNYPIHRFNPDNVRPQCGARCNRWGQGMPAEFRPALIFELGLAVVERMEDTRHDIFRPTKQWYIRKIKHYRRKNAT